MKSYDVDSFGKKIHFEKNVNLKPINCSLAWTTEQVEEYIKCNMKYYVCNCVTYTVI